MDGVLLVPYHYAFEEGETLATKGHDRRSGAPASPVISDAKP